MSDGKYSIYIASHDQKEANRIATIVENEGHKITSTWLNENFESTSKYSIKDRKKIANRDYEDVMKSDVLILISGEQCSGGKFVEAGIALGLGKRVIIAGRPENMLMYHPRIEIAKSIPELIKILRRR